MSYTETFDQKSTRLMGNLEMYLYVEIVPDNYVCSDVPDMEEDDIDIIMGMLIQQQMEYNAIRDEIDKKPWKEVKGNPKWKMRTMWIDVQGLPV